MSKQSSFLQRQRNFWSEALWKPKTKHSLEQLKYLHYVLTKNAAVNEHNRDLLVETLRSMAEILIWGDQNDAHVMDFFLEKNMLSFFLKIMRQKYGRFVCVQLLQTLNILFENMRNETSLYYLLSNNHINSIIVHKFDFSDEEVLAYYISFLKTLSLKLNKHTIHFFYNEHRSDFPLYSEAIQFFNHSESMVRIAVRTISLNVYQVGDTSVLEYICNKSAVPYFTNLVWFIGSHVLQLNECIATTASHLERGRLESMVAEQLDLVHYLNDIFCLGVEPLNRLLVCHLLDRLVIPLYIYSLKSSQQLNGASEEQPRIVKLLSLFLLAQKLLIMKHGPLVTSLAEFILRGETHTSDESGSETATKISGHSRYPSHSSLRAFMPPEEPIGVVPITTSQSSSESSVRIAVAQPASPTVSAKSVGIGIATPVADIRTASPASGGVLSGSSQQRSNPLGSFTGTADGGGAMSSTSSEYIPMVSVNRSGPGGLESRPDDFTVTVLEQRTTTVGKSRFFSSETTERSVTGGEQAMDTTAAESSAIPAADETDGAAVSAGLVVGACDEVAMEEGADLVATATGDLPSPSTVASSNGYSPAAQSTGSDLLLHSDAERVQAASSSHTNSEVDSGVFSEQITTAGSTPPDTAAIGAITAITTDTRGELTPANGTSTSACDTCDVCDSSVQREQQQSKTLTESSDSPQDRTLLAESDESRSGGMSPYLQAMLSSLKLQDGDDRQALFSIVVFYAVLRHKGVAPEVFENVDIGEAQTCEDVRSLLMDHVIQLISQICHDCSTSRLITLQAALVVLQNLMKDDRRSAALLPQTSAPPPSTTPVATLGEATPPNAALTTTDGGISPSSSRDALAFEDSAPAVPNELPTNRESLSTGSDDSYQGGMESLPPAMADISPAPVLDLARNDTAAAGAETQSALSVRDTASQSQSQLPPAFHNRVCDGHIAQLHSAYEDSILQLRLFYKGSGDDIFLDMFEDEYFNITKGERLNIEYLMNDASTLLPPTPTPLTGILFSKRLPNGEVERARRAMQVFFLARQLVVNLLGEKEEYLPLMPVEGLLKVDDRPNLINTDLLGCSVYMDDTEKPLKRFFFIAESQIILVEPDTTQLGWGIVRYVANLEDIDVATDSGDNSLLHVTFHQPLSKRRRFGNKPSSRQKINTWQFEFNDHIRCMAAKKRIMHACERIKATKQRKVCALLQLPESEQPHAPAPSNITLVGLDAGTVAARPTMAIAPSLAAAAPQVTVSPMTVPPSVPAPRELVPLVVDTNKPASAAVSRNEGGFEVISVDDPSGLQDIDPRLEDTQTEETGEL